MKCTRKSKKRDTHTIFIASNCLISHYFYSSLPYVYTTNDFDQFTYEKFQFRVIDIHE